MRNLVSGRGGTGKKVVAAASSVVGETVTDTDTSASLSRTKRSKSATSNSRVCIIVRKMSGSVAPVVAAEESLLFALPMEIRKELKARGQSDKMRHDAGSLH